MSEDLISSERAHGDLLAAAAYLGQHIKSGEGYSDAMKVIVPLYLERDEVDVAAELANSLSDPFTRDRLLIQVAEKCAEIGDDDYALQLADAIEDVGMQSQARERVAIKKALAGEFERASDLAEQVLHPDYVFAEIASGLAAAGRVAESEVSLNRIELPLAHASALQEIALRHLKTGQTVSAVEYLDKARVAARQIEHNEERVRALGEIAVSFIEAGRNDLAIESYEIARDEAEMLTSGHREVFLSGIAIGLLRAGNIDLADSVLDLVTDKTQVASGLLGFSRQFWNAEDKDEAMEALEEGYSIARSQKENETRDSRAANNVMGSIAVQFSMFGKHERAIEIAQENRDPGERLNSLGRIAQVAASGSDDAAASAAIAGIDDDASRVFALIGAADGWASSGNNEKALASLNEAVDIAKDLPQPLMRTSAFEAAAPLYLKYGTAEKSLETCRTALDSIALIRNDSDRAAALANLSDIYRRCGFDAEAEEKEILAAILRTVLW